MFKSWFEKEEAYKKIQNCISSGQTEVRIAVGYFSVEGWNLIRAAIGGKQVDLIVGINEPGRKDIRNVKQVIIEEIIRALETGLAEDRRQSVEVLVEIIKAGKFQIVDGRAYQHHGKVYIADSSIAIVCSANLSKKGLRQQTEAGIDVYEADEIENLIKKFDIYFAQARNLTEELLNALINWLKYASPWEAYLKTLLAFEDLNTDNRYMPPAIYQLDLIGQTLRHIREYKGSMLVASTGLGKTVVATHVALQLKIKDEIENVLVLCPKLVKKAWKTAFRQASIHCDTITYNALDKENLELDFNLEDFLEIEPLINSKWLIVVDESHYFRNSKENTEGFKRRSFQRLTNLIERSDCKLLLLTGSPYSKDIDNLNDQLLLLPHTNDQLPLVHNYAWQAETVKEFIDLPVVSQLTTPFVAKEYGCQENDSIFIEFGESKKYIPSVNLYKLNIPFFLENEITKIIQSKILSVITPVTSRNTINIEIQKCWASSPDALHYALAKVIDTPNGNNPYDVIFELSQTERKEQIIPILEKLENLDFSEDKKLLVLVKIIQNIYENGEKIIIFCERRATVSYLEKALKTFITSIKIFVTIKYQKGKYSQKSTKLIEKSIKHFAPLANSVEIRDQETYDIFISTDSHGVGINLQDAPVVINYDLAWTPIEPIQRAGRVLRPWNSPRTVKLYSFFPVTSNDNLENISIIKRSQNLTERHSISQTILDLPVLPLENIEEIKDLSTVASNISIQSGKLDIDTLALEPMSSSLQQHTSTLYKNRRDILQIKNLIVTSKIYSGKKIRIYILLKYREKFHRVIYSINYQSNKINYLEENPSLEKLLGWLKCDPDTPKAYVTLKEIEKLADKCIQKWCQKIEIDCDEVIRVCIFYLKPKQNKDEIVNLAR